MRWHGMMVTGLLAFFVVQPVAALDCHSRRFTWTDSDPAINRRHVFCGEIDHGQPKGVHSTRLLASSAVVRRIESKSGDRDGIYEAIVIFTNGRRKLSTFFPDRCTVEQITQSIYHAATNITASHRSWGFVGPSAPTPKSGGGVYCHDNEGKSFEIRLGRLKNGRINTAFPN